VRFIIIYDRRRMIIVVLVFESIVDSRFLPAKLTSRFLLPLSSRQIEKSISIADFFPPNRGVDF
jgi:hypothetical protein